MDLRYKEKLESVYINIPNFPIEGFDYPEINPMFEKHPMFFQKAIDYMLTEFRIAPPDVICCIESYGFLVGSPLAYSLGCKMVFVRKKGKLPREVISESYSMVYGEDRVVEIHSDVIVPGDRVLIVDDFLASGGTAAAAARLITKLGGNIVGFRFLTSIQNLFGNKTLFQYSPDVLSLVEIEFDESLKKWLVVDSKL